MKKKVNELTTEQIKTSIYNYLHKYIGDVSGEATLIELIEKYGERRFDEGYKLGFDDGDPYSL